MAGVSLRGVSKSFGAVRVVEGIDLDVADHEFVSFLGPSGCGKTTTLRLIAGFETPSTGEITIGERVVSSVERGVFVPPEERAIGMVFQNYAVWPHMSVEANVGYPLRIKKVPRGEARERVARALDLVQLAGYEPRYPHQLSGGQQQRVALARALVMEPAVLLLDEPLSNLDAKLREEMRFEIKDLQARLGITIVYVTHDQAEAMAMSDRIMLLHDARIQQVGTARDLYTRPANRFVASFVGLINVLEAEVTAGGRAALAGADGGSPLEVRVPPGVGGSCFVAVRPENVRLLPPGQGSLRGVVRNKVYLGNVIDYRVQSGTVTLRSEAAPSQELEVGAAVGIGLEGCLVFPA